MSPLSQRGIAAAWPRAAWRAGRAAPRGAALLAIVTLAGLGLRLAFSRAPLWNDEIWSLQNLAGVNGVGGILWGISHDNNHFLNSLWLYWASPITLAPTALRALSIVVGVLAVPAMADLGGRRSPAAGHVAALLTAFSFFQVVYSDEARGYAVATLCLVLAYREVEIALDEPKAARRWRLALACGVGFFAHLAFGPSAAALAFIALLETIVRRRGRPVDAALVTFRLFWPTALAFVPTLIFLAAGWRNRGGFTIGAFTPFSVAHAVGGATQLEMMTFGLDPTSFAQTAFALVGLPILIVVAILLLAPRQRKSTYLVMIVLPPVLAIALKLPNTHIARYFFAASPFLILLAADAYAELSGRSRFGRALATGLIFLTLVANGAALARLAAGEAAPWTEALDIIAQSQDRTLATSFDFNIGKSVAFYNATNGAPLRLVASEKICAEKPAWRIVQTGGDGKAEPMVTVGAPDCDLAYRLEGVFNRNVPSQLPWALYHATR